MVKNSGIKRAAKTNKKQIFKKINKIKAHKITKTRPLQERHWPLSMNKS